MLRFRGHFQFISVSLEPHTGPKTGQGFKINMNGLKYILFIRILINYELEALKTNQDSLSSLPKEIFAPHTPSILCAEPLE